MHMRLNSPTASVVRAAGVVGVVGLALALVGCATSGRNDGGRHSRAQGDVSPELDTLDKRPIDIDDRMYYTWDTNGRMFWDDVYSAMLFDRPSRLSNNPTPW
jgi:hypothetical protein